MKELAIDLRGLRRQLDSGARTTVTIAAAAPRVSNRRGSGLAGGSVALVLLVAAYSMSKSGGREARATCRSPDHGQRHQ